MRGTRNVTEPINVMAKEYVLQAETELRIELSCGGEDGGPGDVVTVTLEEGSAEVFGVPLAEGKGYSWGRGEKLAIFTWYGCRLRLVGLSSPSTSSLAYVSDETPMVAYVNTHAQLEARRDHAAALHAKLAAATDPLEGGPYTNTIPPAWAGSSGGPSPASGEGRPLACGPRVVVCGPPDSGKSSLCAFLVAAAVRLGRAPLLVDLDPSLGSLGVPGCIGATPVMEEE